MMLQYHFCYSPFGSSSVIISTLSVIATGIQASDSPLGLGGVEWSLWPKENLEFSEENLEFSEAFLGITNS